MAKVDVTTAEKVIKRRIELFSTTEGDTNGYPLEERFSDLLVNIKYGKYNSDCVILGTLGLWDGRHTIVPVKCNTLVEAIEKLCRNEYECTVYMENGVIYAEQAHHDGTNLFEVRMLNERGLIGERDLSKKMYHRKVRGYLF